MFRTFMRIVRRSVNRLGYDLTRIPPARRIDLRKAEEKYLGILREQGVDKAHYGCGEVLFGAGWVNIDADTIYADPAKLFLPADLTLRHPFPSDFFRFQFSEDFLEHLDQAESIIFLAEAFRCLKPGGVLRLSFPGLRSVLREHYTSGGYEGAALGRQKEYEAWGHKHIYCEESLTLVATHIGFTKVDFVDFGISEHEELCGLDSRKHQIGFNVYCELTK